MLALENRVRWVALAAFLFFFPLLSECADLALKAEFPNKIRVLDKRVTIEWKLNEEETEITFLVLTTKFPKVVVGFIEERGCNQLTNSPPQGVD
jgi:hypothetical protein